MLNESAFFWVFITFFIYEISAYVQRKTKLAVFNPLLLTILISVLLIVVTKTEYKVYENNTKIIGYLLTPATVCLAVPLYEKLSVLKRNAFAILIGIFSGVLTSGICVFLVAVIFKLDQSIYASFVPKSVTTAIGVGVAEEFGGISSLTAITIIITGIVGNILAENVCKLFKITHPVAKGIAIGTSSHAGGTAKAIEMGKTEGAVSGLAIAVAGIMTVIIAPLFNLLYK